MKKIILFTIMTIWVLGANAQVVQSESSNSSGSNSMAFIDGSSSTGYAAFKGAGKGILFPSTDVRDINAADVFDSGSVGSASANPNFYDGLIVYNTGTGAVIGDMGSGGADVAPGFYYYSNPARTAWDGGTWLPLGGSSAGKFIDGDTATDAVYTAGNVGIGTTAPNAPLQFSNTTNNRKLVLNEQANNDHQFYGFGVNSNILRYQIAATNHSHVFYAGSDSSNSVELMRIQGNQRVGIRRDNPDKTLSVLGEFSITSDVNITAPGFANYISNFNNGSGLLLKKVGSGSGNYYQAQAHNGTILFNIDRDGDGYFLDKVSVGTTSKTHSFNVGLGHSSNAVAHIEDSNTGSSGLAGLTLRDRGNADADAETWQLRVSDNGQLGIGELDDAETSFQERLTLDQDGEVGIGTTNPTDDLHVDGDVRITGTLKDTSNLAGTAGQVLSSTSTGTAWIENSPLSLSDTDIDTKIQVEETADDDLIRFDLEGTEQFVMDGPRLEVVNSGASVFIGQNAGANDDLSSNSNVFVGFNSGSTNVSGSLNTAVGAHTLEDNTTGANNTANGAYALRNNTTGGSNTALGRSAMQGNTTGNTNSAIGYHALSSNQSGSANVAVGYYAMIQNITGTQNTALGTTALQNNTSGNYNTAQGYASLRSNTEGDNNTALGYTALGGNSTGNENTVIGRQALVSNTTGSKNTVVGSRALINLNITDDTASNNTAIGFEAGSGIVTGKHNTILGANVGGLPSALSNNIIIADGEGNQRIRVVANGDLGIGTTSPTDDLHVDGDVRITGTLKDASNSAGTAGQVLSSTSTGTVWLNANAIPVSLRTVSADTSITSSDGTVVVRATSTTAIDVTLPLASAVSGGSYFIVKRLDNGATPTAVNIAAGNTTDTIDGNTNAAYTTQLANNAAKMTLQSDGIAAWYIVSQ